MSENCEQSKKYLILLSKELEKLNLSKKNPSQHQESIKSITRIKQLHQVIAQHLVMQWYVSNKNKTQEEALRWVADLGLDFRKFPHIQKIGLDFFDREMLEDFPYPIIVDGSIGIGEEVNINLNTVEVVTGRVVFTKSKEVNMNSLKKIHGNLAVYLATKITIDSLEEVNGQFLAPYLKEVSAKSLRIVSGDMYLSSAESIDLPSIEVIAGNLEVPERLEVPENVKKAVQGTIHYTED